MDTRPVAINRTEADDAGELLDAQLASAGLQRESVPSTNDWTGFLELVEDTYRGFMAQAEAATNGIESLLGNEVAQNRSGMANLFSQSPVPILEHDYRQVVAWMDDMRADGVVDLVTHLADRPELIGKLATGVEVTAVNPAAAKMLGAPGSRPSFDADLYREISAASWLAQFKMIWDSETSTEAVFEGTRADGSAFDGMLAVSVPTPFEIPDYSRVVVSMIDITAQRLEERRIKDLVEAKNRLLANVTDVVHTPLNTVLGFVEGLSTEDDLDQRHDTIGDVVRQAAEVRDVIEDLLVTSQSELGELTLARVPVDLEAQLAQVLEAGGSAMDFVQTPGRHVEDRIALGDPERVRQIMRNLLSNALRFGGPEVVVRVRRRVGTLYVSVQDNGIGLSRADEQRISHHSPTDEPVVRPGSIGMGLTVAHELAHLMDGELSYRRESGRSVFELALPAMELPQDS